MGAQLDAARIGWLGVGNMGAPLLQRLLDAGHRVVAFDPRADAQQALHAASGEAVRAASVTEVALHSDVVFLSLPSIEAMREAVGELVRDGAARVRLVVNTGTTGASLSHELAPLLESRGAHLVDAPVSGGPEAARAGVLSVMASGRAQDIEQLRPLFALWGPNLTIAGESPGAAQTLKLVNNAVIVAAYVATLEAFLFGAKAGLDPQVMLGAMNAGRLAPNGTTRVWLPDYILRDKAFGAQLHLLMKDMGLALSESESQHAPLRVSQAALEAARQACGPALDEHADLMDLMKAMESRAGFRVARTPAGPTQ
ncbi:MAG: NAD(P)-dependent oxidoreductase [Rubrivivax sp.]|nr:NAD(P)-dependent oxidoreductase [Rubrivivax sp.]